MMLSFVMKNSFFALVVKFDQLFDALLVAIIVGAFGLIIFGTAYFVLHLVLPFSIRKEIEETQNPALGIIIASIMIGIAIIIAAAIKN